jgi:hypothetical protein
MDWLHYVQLFYFGLVASEASGTAAHERLHLARAVRRNGYTHEFAQFGTPDSRH